ncbi:MAG TPA: phosphodiesterase, partial [Myxococcaceae bacterium]|nr:phosphodiesterase [Myxococcaceae bacterium]
QAVEMLYRVDARLEELYAVGRQLPSPYDLVLVADHGHVDAVPLETKFGTRLRPHLMEGPVPPLGEALERALLDGRAPLVEGGGRPALERDPEVVESGNFAHIYLSRAAEPLEARQILVRHREVLSRASHSPALGLVALRRGNSAVALIQGNAYGPHELDAAPLSSAFSKRAVADLLQELPQMPTAGDLVLYGEAVGQGATVGFAWEFGSHGGLTREETDSWVCWPADAPLDLSAIGHATQLHRRLATLYRAG